MVLYKNNIFIIELVVTTSLMVHNLWNIMGFLQLRLYHHVWGPKERVLFSGIYSLHVRWRKCMKSREEGGSFEKQ